MSDAVFPSPGSGPAERRGGGALRRPRGSRRGRRRVSPRTAWTAVVAGTALLATAVVVTGAEGFTPTSFQLSASSAWLPSFTVGQVALVDGTTADTVAKVQVVKRPTSLDVVQNGSTAFVVNRGDGTVTRVDGATLDTVNAQPFPDSKSVQAYPGKESLYLYDRERGALATMDAATLAVRRKTSLDPAANENSTLVDGRGRFWIISSRDGSINHYDALGNRSSAAKVSDPAQSQLITVKEQPVLVESGRSEVRPLDSESGELGEETCVAGVGHRLRSGGSPTRNVVYFSDGQAGALLTSDLDDRSCDGFIQISPAGSDLGPPLEAAGHVFIADRTHSTVAIVNPITGKVITVALPVTPREPFDLLTHSGIVWYNQPETERAGVITVDGRHLDSRKYDPKNPKGDLPGSETATKTKAPRNATNSRPATVPPSPSVTPTSTPTATPTPTSSASPPASPDPSRPDVTASPNAPADLKIWMDPPLSPELGRPYSFKVTSSRGQLVGASWDFGDVTNGEGLTVSHVYSEAKTYLVTAKGRFADGTSSTATITLTVHAKPAVQITSLSPSEAKEDVPTTFRATFRNGPPKTYLWHVLDPDNKTIYTSNDPQPTFTFTEPTPDAGKPYVVTLVVDDDFVGGQGAQNVTVGPTKPAGVSAACSQPNIVLGETIRCSATASGAFVTWTWTLTGPSGTVTEETGESPDFSYVPPVEGDYTVQAVASNRTGASDPTVPVPFGVRKTAFEGLDCSPTPVRAEEPMSCVITFDGWLGAFDFSSWVLRDLYTGMSIDGSSATPLGGGAFRINTTIGQPGTYGLTVTYENTLISAYDTIKSGTVEVARAQRDLQVVVKGPGEVKEGSNSCSSTCTWSYSDGDKISLRALADDDTKVVWSGACSGEDKNCSLTVGSGSTVTVEFKPPGTLNLEVRGTTDNCANGGEAQRAAALGMDVPSYRLVAAAVPLADDPPAEEPTTTTTTTTTTKDEKPTTTTKDEPPTTTTKAPDKPTTTTTTKPACESNLGKGNVRVVEIRGDKREGKPSCAERASGSCTYRSQVYVQWEMSDADGGDDYVVDWSNCSWESGGKCYVDASKPGDNKTARATFKTKPKH